MAVDDEIAVPVVRNGKGAERTRVGVLDNPLGVRPQGQQGSDDERQTDSNIDRVICDLLVGLGDV